MKARISYTAAAVVLLVLEVLIALYVHDALIRPFGGDVLVTVLLCCIGRAMFLHRLPYLPLWVFLFAWAVELLQAVGVASLIPAWLSWLRIVVGSVFSWWDIVCYALGCLIFAVAEKRLFSCIKRL